jgi:hypothetical protein
MIYYIANPQQPFGLPFQQLWRIARKDRGLAHTLLTITLVWDMHHTSFSQA